MVRRIVAASLFVVAVVDPRVSFAKVPGASSTAPQAAHREEVLTARQIASGPEAEAQQVRLQIVQTASAQFGPSFIDDWNHAKDPYPTQRDTFVLAFVKLLAQELSAQSPEDIGASKVKTTVFRASGASRLLWKAVGGALGPAGDVADLAASVGSKMTVTTGAQSSSYEAHLKEVQAIAEVVLPADDYQNYLHAAATGDYVTQVSLLYKINYEVLATQAVINPYVLWWCDMRGPDGRIGSMPTIDFFPELAPGDQRFKPATWNGLTQEQKWKAVDENLKQFFRETTAELADPNKRTSVLNTLKLASEVKQKRGSLLPEGAQVNRDYVAALGKQALETYDHAQGEKRSEIAKAAMLFTGGVNSLFCMLIGDPDLGPNGSSATDAVHRRAVNLP